ncbi:hypothetical protein SOVF_012370 [Spinacia oleracea]|nr:hypothetical protein SOVF_012370 [Spinacia oleracea]
MDDSNSSTPSLPLIHDFSLDFVEQDLNFNHVIEMLRGSETSDPSSICVNQNFDPLSLTPDNNYGMNFYQIPQDNVFNNFSSPTMSCTNNSLLNSLSGFDDETVRGEDEEEDDDDDDDNYLEAGEHSSATTKTTTKKGKLDRSRTLVSERKRRGRMKEKLYALRALVPNITKMDKASIVGDAVLYVQDLQMQSKKLKSQIEGLESSLKAADRGQGFADNPKKNASLDQFIPVCKIIMQVAKCREEFNLPNMKVWISGALLNQGFEFQCF